MSKTIAHVINHTHWDREWFLTKVYTSRWVSGLIDKLEELVAANPDFCFLFDGQTLVIEDLLGLEPAYRDRVDRLIANGNLIIGPYYCQPDWQLTGGELLIRNLIYGRKDMERHGSTMATGWMVDTFGHISQSPQIHQLFGIDAVFVWRGVPALEPYFEWRGVNGDRLLAIDLFGGYRNLYGITHAPEVAVKRLVNEVNNLGPFYPTPDIPLFDGYDLEDSPEDPLRFYAENGGVGDEIQLQGGTPTSFAEVIAAKNLPLPIIDGELNSGKFGATFPGTFSARTYLKVMARDCEQMLFQRCEPLATLARLRGRSYDAAHYEAIGRELLQNAVHDCICGVSIDQVHERMEYSYREVFGEMVADMQASLTAIFHDFKPGAYAVSTTPFAVDQWQIAGDELVYVQTNGVGVWPLTERTPIEAVDEAISLYTWQSDHYKAVVKADGRVHINGAMLGQLVVSDEHGDTYSDEIGDELGILEPTGPLTIAARSAQNTILAFPAAWQDGDRRVTANVRLIFDPSPLLKWEIDLDSRGTDLRVDMVFETGKRGRIHAGMPFDVVERQPTDTDLLPREAPSDLAPILLGQRELNAVSTFPNHDFVALSNEDGTVAILNKGVRSYDTDEQGRVRLHLRRAVEWLTAADLRDRIGDAGPFFYVPDARCERIVRHEVAVAFGNFIGDSMELQRINAVYQNPPLIVESAGDGEQTTWQLLREDLPLAGLQVMGEQVLARFVNPTPRAQALSISCTRTDLWGQVQGRAGAAQPKEIVTVQLADSLPAVGAERTEVILLSDLQWRVGDNTGLPDPAILADLAEKIIALGAQLAEIESQLTIADTTARLRLQHRYYVLERERLEFQLSHLLNRRKLAENGALGYAYLYEPDDEIAAIGLNLNRLRIKRRIFDYVVAVL